MDIENQVEESVENIWEMDDAEFSQLDLDEVETEVPSDEGTTTSEEVEEEDAEEEEESTEEEQDAVDTSEGEEPAEEPEESEEPPVDFSSEYKKIVGTPIRANGKDITIDSAEDAIKLIQMGANYYKNMEQLKPAQKIVKMLEQAQMMDTEKLSFAIDVMNKDPAAIQRLLSDMDLHEVLDDKHSEYTPKTVAVSDTQIDLDNVINTVMATPSGSQTLRIVGELWDASSRQMVVKHPEVIQLINQHVEDGTYDAVTQEVEKFRMLGKIPVGYNDVQAYKYVGDLMYANPSTAVTPTGQSQQRVVANTPPIKKPTKETVVKQKRAASNTARASSHSLSQSMENVFELSDEEFRAKYGKF